MDQRRHRVDFTDEYIRRVRQFAEDAVQYNYNRGQVQQDEGVRRLVVGKLGKIGFALFLHRNNKRTAGHENMFTVWEDVYAADRQDFLTGDNRTIYIKTASKNFYRRITIPEEHFIERPPDFYVGIRIMEDLERAVIVGYTSHDEIQEHGIYRGPNPARNYRYASYDLNLSQLSPIQGLLDLIDDNNHAAS